MILAYVPFIAGRTVNPGSITGVPFGSTEAPAESMDFSAGSSTFFWQRGHKLLLNIAIHRWWKVWPHIATVMASDSCLWHSMQTQFCVQFEMCEASAARRNKRSSFLGALLLGNCHAWFSMFAQSVNMDLLVCRLIACLQIHILDVRWQFHIPNRPSCKNCLTSSRSSRFWSCSTCTHWGWQHTMQLPIKIYRIATFRAHLAFQRMVTDVFFQLFLGPDFFLIMHFCHLLESLARGFIQRMVEDKSHMCCSCCSNVCWSRSSLT